MEAVPVGIDSDAVRRCLTEIPGVAGVHDLHVWCLTEGSPILTAHLVVDRSVPASRVLRDATDQVAAAFGISHVTLQVEPPDFNIVHGPGLEMVQRSDGS
jgi:cobalt-zinc-cadmium efflux system protein